ncbi:EamA family transporter [Rhodococcus triatomae]|uniref:Inner membrane transporter RhtA n=1 Tax=Rhodococcus triatomae TaxID=300028 RepID=A0A1G8JGZ5_9NOCA|nr:EamA family transporter [Rhodococcus triatomae]QNG19731.1 EamA family transporter [Rhodococcus triatomae]QNG24353.1 EamA family transporter [Rhodococcus triatomae]SDI29900.1 inner membrane transporter RhtA [Rhodococcus triatomae]
MSTHEDRGQALPTAAVLVSILSVQFGAAFATTLFDRVGASGAVFLRLTIAAIVLGVLVRPNPRRWSRTQLHGVLALGLALAVMNAAFYEALSRLPLGTAVTIEFLGPLTLAAVLTRRPRDALWVLLAFAGVALLGLRDQHGGLDGVGVGFALVAATAWAGYILAGSNLAATLPSADGLAGASIVAAVLVLPFGVASGGAVLVDPTVLAVGAAVALLSSVVPYTLELWSLRVLHKKVFAVLIALEPAAAALAGALVLGQLLGGVTLFAIALVVVAGIGSVVTGRR